MSAADRAQRGMRPGLTEHVAASVFLGELVRKREEGQTRRDWMRRCTKHAPLGSAHTASPRQSRLPETRLHDQQGDPAALRLADLHRSPSFSSPCPPRLGISDGSCPHSHSQHHCESVGHSGGRLLRGAAVCLIAPVRRVIARRNSGHPKSGPRTGFLLKY